MPDFAVSTSFTVKDQLTSFFSKGESAATRFEAMVRSSFDRSGRSASLFSKIVGGVTLGNLASRGIQAAAREVKNLIVDSKEAAKSKAALDTAYKSVFGADAKNQFSFASSEANRLGLDIEKTARSYMQLAAASKGTKLAGGITKELFMGISEAATSLKLAPEQSEGAILAVLQMISKGKISSEELRRQLGERIPGAFSIAARAMGTTERRLDKMISTGRITAEKFIPLFAAQLRKEFSASAVEAAKDFSAIEQRFENLKLTMRQGIGRVILPILSRVYEKTTPIIENITRWVGANQELISTRITSFLDNMAEAIKNLASSPYLRDFAKIVKEVVPYIKEFGPGILGAVAGYKAAEFALKGAAGIISILTMTANPIQTLCVGVALLAGSFTLLANEVGGAGPALGVMWNWVKTLGVGIRSSLLYPIEKLFDLLGNLPGDSGAVYRSMAKGLADFRIEGSKWAGGNGEQWDFGAVVQRAVGAKEVEEAKALLRDAKTDLQREQAMLDLKAAQIKAETGISLPDDPAFWQFFKAANIPPKAPAPTSASSPGKVPIASTSKQELSKAPALSPTSSSSKVPSTTTYKQEPPKAPVVITLYEAGRPIIPALVDKTVSNVTTQNNVLLRGLPNSTTPTLPKSIIPVSPTPKSSPRQAPNKEEIDREKNSFWGRLDIAGAPEGSKITQKSRGPATIKVELMGANR